MSADKEGGGFSERLPGVLESRLLVRTAGIVALAGLAATVLKINQWLRPNKTPAPASDDGWQELEIEEPTPPDQQAA